MALIKRNIWSLFYIILFIGVIILGATIFNIYKDTKAYHASKQESFVNVNATAIYSTFLQYEMLLDILGDQLTQNNNYESFEKSRTILDNLLKLESPITAFGLAKPNGQLYVTSSNLKNIKKLPNLMKNKETKESFKYSLDKDFMVIGRTYFHNTLNSLIIPIRKAIKNKDGETIAVMTAGINVNEAFNLPDSVIIFRDLDYYNQIIAKYKTAEFKKKYQKPLPSSYVEGVFNKVEKNYKRNINYFKNKEEIFSSEYKKFRENTTVLSSIKYINRYKLWVIQQKDSDIITKQIVEKSLLYTVLFIILFSILYYIFKLINDFEKQKNDALYHQATHDYLTNLHNRLYLSNRFEYLNEKTDSEFSLLFIDMDNFKSINDNYGHDYGDLILEEISERLLKFKTSNEIGRAHV